MATNNATILADAYLRGSNDYQRRTTYPTQSNIDKTVSQLTDPLNGDIFNEFMSYFVNRIGMTEVHSKEWTSPLAPFKKSKLLYGSTVQEAAVQWVKAHSYDDESETLLKMQRPEANVWYHTLNRKEHYDITINREELRQAFTDEYGLNKLAVGIMQAPINSDNYDEYNCMKELIAIYNERWGFFKHHLDTVPTDEASGKELLTALRAYGDKLTFPTTLYNANVIDIPVFARPEELVLMVTPETNASLDVNTLSAMFHLDKGDIKYRTVVIDEFPIPNAVALLTTADFFQCRDVEYTTTSFYNAERLDTTYYLHHWEIISPSPFVPAILFTTDEGTEVKAIEQNVTGCDFKFEENEIAAGDIAQTVFTLNGTIENGTPKVDTVEPDSCTYKVSSEEGVTLNSRTYVDRFGRLHTQKAGIAGKTITVEATATYINPSGETQTFMDSASIKISE